VVGLVDGEGFLVDFIVDLIGLALGALEGSKGTED
jgi:hypothetical protein